MATARKERVRTPSQHPDDAAPVTWPQIDRAWKAYQAGDRGHSLEEMKARRPRRTASR
jgi:hypothetical protein